MPRYFFHLVSTLISNKDDHGLILPDDHAARAEGLCFARELAEEAKLTNWQTEDLMMVVTDADARVVCNLPVRLPTAAD